MMKTNNSTGEVRQPRFSVFEKEEEFTSEIANNKNKG
jgi:hypothetical protein